MNWRYYDIDDLILCLEVLDTDIECLENELMFVHNNMLTEDYDFFYTPMSTIKWFASDFWSAREELADFAKILASLEDDLDHAVYSQYQLVWQTMMSRYNACKKHYAQDVTLRINFRR